MSLKSNYVVNQVLSITRDDLISNGALGSYCMINFNNYSDPELFIQGITKTHLTRDKQIIIVPSLNTTIVYVNKNNYYLLFTNVIINDIPPIGPLITDGALDTTVPVTDESGASFRWIIFENINNSFVEAITDASGSLTSDYLTSMVWFSGPTLSNGLYKIVYDVQTYPIYNKPWTRWRPPCVRCPGQGMLCNSQYSQTDLDMRRKAEVLLYRKNAMPISRKMNWRQAVKIANKRKNKNTYASQSVSYTNPNTQNLVRIDNKLIVNPPGFKILDIYGSIVPDYVLGDYCTIVSDFEILLHLPAAYTQPEYITTPQKFYFSYKNINNVYLTSVDEPAKLFNSANKFKIGIIFDSSGNLIASCKYNIELQDYTTTTWSVKKGNIFYYTNIISRGNCTTHCKTPPLPPTFSNVPGKGPNLYMDQNIPLTQYITRRTYKGTSENVTRLFSEKGVQGRWDDYSYEIRRSYGGGGGPGPSPPPGPSPQAPPSTKNCNCKKEGVRDCWSRIGKTNNKYFKLKTVAECSVGGKCECSYIALTLKDTTSGPSKINLHPQIPLYWAGKLQDDSIEFMSERDPCGKAGGGSVSFFLGESGICYLPEEALLNIYWVNGQEYDESSWTSNDIWTARDLFSKQGWKGKYTMGAGQQGTATAYFTSHPQ